LKIEVLKLEDGVVFEDYGDDLIEYIEDPEFVEYEFIEAEESESRAEFEHVDVKVEDEAKYDDKSVIITIKMEMDQQFLDTRDGNLRCSNRKCKREDVSFATQAELDDHNFMHVRQIDKHICPICNKTLANAGKLSNHMETRHIPKSFTCDNCGKVFKSKDNLRLHMSHHRKHFIVECRACKKTYKSMQSLRYHLRQHFEHHQCETCGKVRELLREFEAIC
jgi:RNase P subunit RPR2